MSGRFDLIQTDAGYHAVHVAGNNEPVVSQEVVNDRDSAVKAVVSLAMLFHPNASAYRVEGDVLKIYYEAMGSEEFVAVEVHLADVDQRGEQ